MVEWVLCSECNEKKFSLECKCCFSDKCREEMKIWGKGLNLGICDPKYPETKEGARDYFRDEIAGKFKENNINPYELDSSLWNNELSWEMYVKKAESREKLDNFVENIEKEIKDKKIYDEFMKWMIDKNVERITKIGGGAIEITRNGRKQTKEISNFSDGEYAAIRYLEKNNRQFITWKQIFGTEYKEETKPKEEKKSEIGNWLALGGLVVFIAVVLALLYMIGKRDK